MNILIIGSGGREHALCYALHKENHIIYALPGSDVMADIVAYNIPHKVDDIEAICNSAVKYIIDLVIVGPELPLMLGVVDRLREMRIHVLGPTACAARLEGSKNFMKKLCSKYNIPTAKFTTFHQLHKAMAYVDTNTVYPLVIKADGLASGKGVFIVHNRGEAHDALFKMMRDKIFGVSGSTVVIESFLFGKELSYFALCDGQKVLPLGSVQDYKTLFNGNKGPNTGGMGAVTPVNWCDFSLEDTIQHTILYPLVNAMQKEKCPYTGVLFLGIIVTKDGPFLLECNVRFGDPECQTLMQTCQKGLFNLLMSCASGDLPDNYIRSKDCVVSVVLAAKGYPGVYEKGVIIPNLSHDNNILILHAGTKKENDHFISIGGRVLNIIAKAPTVFLARKMIYDFIKMKKLDDLFLMRTDIGEN